MEFPRKPVSFVAGVLSGSHWSAGNREHKGPGELVLKMGGGRLPGCGGGNQFELEIQFPVSLVAHCRTLEVSAQQPPFIYRRDL